MKLKTQIQLDKVEQDALRTWARQRGISMSAMVRWLIRERLQKQSKPKDIIKNFLSSSGVISSKDEVDDASQMHDLYIYEDDKADS